MRNNAKEVLKSKMIPLRDLAKKNRVPGRVARRRLRDSGFEVSSFRWEFTPAQAKKVEPIIRGN